MRQNNEGNHMSKISQSRPLSPHVGIYRWQFTNTLSILHRMTGVALTLGLVPLALWIWGVAYNPALFDWMSMAFASILGKVCLFGWTVAFFYHFGNGIRHLNWDMGRGLKLEEAKASGSVVVVFALTLSIFIWVLVARKLGML